MILNQNDTARFQAFTEARKHGIYIPGMFIDNPNQTPLTFDLPYSTTVDVKGAKSVSINTTGNEKNRFTVMLVCTAAGGTLPPNVIFKRKTLPKVTWAKGAFIRCQDKGWMDDALMKDWIKAV